MPPTSPITNEGFAGMEDRRAANLTAPISKLNNDILIHTFMFNTQLDLDQVHIPSTTIRRASQVYQRWRDLLLNYPLIWAASLDLADPEAWTEVVLARASDVPLTITLPSLSRAILVEDEGRRRSWLRNIPLHSLSSNLSLYFGFSPSDQQLDLALSLLPRARQFSVTVYRKEQASLIANKIDISAAPQLKELSLLDPQKRGFRICTDSREDSENSPQLKKLNLVGYGVDFLSPMFLNLTTLAASSIDGKGRVPVALRAHLWLQVLRRLPQLKVLVLDNCFDDEMAISDHTPSTRTQALSVSFPHLQILVLKGICRSCHEILSQLHFPASCGMDIDVFFPSKDHELHSASAMMSELCNKVRWLVPSQKITALSLDLSWWKFQVTNVRHASLGDTIFSITLGMIRRVEGMLPVLLRTISSDVNDLYFHYLGFAGSSGPSLPTWTVLEPFEQATNLRLVNEEALSAIACIQHETVLIANQVILPQLSKLSLYMINIETKDVVDNIINMLYERSEIDAPISQILLRSCYGSEVETLVIALRIMGVEVEWDGKTKSEDQETDPFFQ